MIFPIKLISKYILQHYYIRIIKKYDFSSSKLSDFKISIYLLRICNLGKHIILLLRRNKNGDNKFTEWQKDSIRINIIYKRIDYNITNEIKQIYLIHKSTYENSRFREKAYCRNTRRLTTFVCQHVRPKLVRMAVDPQPEGEFFSVPSAYGHVTLNTPNRHGRSAVEQVLSIGKGLARKPQVQRAKNWSRPSSPFLPLSARRHETLFGEV